MPTPCYMYIESEGNVLTQEANTLESLGEKYVEDHEDEFMVQAISHEMMIPRDPQSGQPTGRRVHYPLTVTKYLDKSSPLLAAALSGGTRLDLCRLSFYRTSPLGQQELYYTVELHDAAITSIRLMMPNALDQVTQHYGHMEEVSFSYREIIWTHEIGGTQGEDDWRSSARG